MAPDTNSTHTPGPWFVDIERGFPMPIEQKDGIEICRVGGNALCIDDPIEAEANARLIAAAPELLAALKDAVQTARNYYALFHDETWKERLTKWDAAIFKAENRVETDEGL